MAIQTLYMHPTHMLTWMIVPAGVLSVLPGYGASTGKELVSNSLIRKVDITVREDMPTS